MIMPYSFTYFKPEVKEWFISNVPISYRVLDVGPGIGTYSDILRSSGYKLDAIEIFEPYIEKYNLKEKYDNVYIGDITLFNIDDYDFIILGDVLEHLKVDDAVNLINSIINSGKECLVAVPYKMEQGEHEGNIYETHHQPDLTIDVMKERYSKLECIYNNEYYGYYTYINIKFEKAYVLYANASYFDTVLSCVKSIKTFSDVPVIVYMLNSKLKIDGALTINWECDVDIIHKQKYIDRTNDKVYKLLIQRPLIVKDALMNHAKSVAYIDADSVATKYVDNIFTMFDNKSVHPYFVEGMYEYLLINGKGGAINKNDLSTTLEHPACELFNVNQYVRQKYRQTGYFVSGQNCIEFLDEWYNMCIHPEVLAHHTHYAPYHEETIVNVLLWKKNIHIGLPYIYINGSYDTINEVYDTIGFNGKDNTVREWVKIPKTKSNLLFFHGEKDSVIMNKMIAKLNSKLKILFLAPHLSTGGMPAFLLKRIEALKSNNDVEIFVVEYQCYSIDYVVQRNQIMNIVNPNFRTLWENKMELFDVINDWKPDVIHIDEMSERLDREMVTKLYSNKRSYRIVETCHDVSFNPNDKMFHPDAYAFCTPHHLKTFNNTISYKQVIEFPIEDLKNKKCIWDEAMMDLDFDFSKEHVVNVGLWTSGKNQKEAVELARQMPDVQFHFIGNMAPNFRDYWHPIILDLPDNCKIWGERDDVYKFLMASDVFMFNSTWECNPLVIREAIGHECKILARDLPQYCGMFDGYITPIGDNLKQQLEQALEEPVTYTIPTNQFINFRDNHIALYKQVVSSATQMSNVSINQHFVNNPFLEIKGTSDSVFKICFYDEHNILQYENTIKANHWVKLNRQWYTKWSTKVWENDEVIYNNVLSLENKRVYIAFDSSSLGDTIAWIPYCLEFKNKHNCDVIVSTFHNYLFESVYPELEFIKPGTPVSNIYAQYNLGWHYDINKEPALPNTIKLQQAATNILGLDFEEIKPRIAFTSSNKFDSKYVTIATNSTAGCKFWTKEGWQEVINFLVNKGYKVINVSKEKNPFDNCTQLEDYSMNNTINTIYYSEFFIGLSSGLSWLAWALGKQVVMIANFSEKDHEFSCIRITNDTLCHGCWNSPNEKFDKGDWDWCPRHKNTPRHFECHRGISSNDVIIKLPL
jgi:autotransporter strand-loop-strand O-heptosyltransferase